MNRTDVMLLLTNTFYFIFIDSFADFILVFPIDTSVHTDWPDAAEGSERCVCVWGAEGGGG